MGRPRGQSVVTRFSTVSFGIDTNKVQKHSQLVKPDQPKKQLPLPGIKFEEEFPPLPSARRHQDESSADNQTAPVSARARGGDVYSVVAKTPRSVRPVIKPLPLSKLNVGGHFETGAQSSARSQQVDSSAHLKKTAEAGAAAVAQLQLVKGMGEQLAKVMEGQVMQMAGTLESMHDMLEEYQALQSMADRGTELCDLSSPGAPSISSRDQGVVDGPLLGSMREAMGKQQLEMRDHLITGLEAQLSRLEHVLFKATQENANLVNKLILLAMGEDTVASA